MSTCNDCLHSRIDLQGDQASGGMVCRRFPPVPVPITVPTATGVSIQIHAVYPPVKDGSGCGEFQLMPNPTIRMDS